MSLDKIAQGMTVTVLSIDAGRGLTSRLAGMGLIPGVELTIINNSRGGPFVIGLKDARLMLGRGMAQKILVQ